MSPPSHLYETLYTASGIARMNMLCGHSSMYQVGMTGGTFPQEKLNVLRLVLRAVGPQYITVIFPSVVCNKILITSCSVHPILYNCHSHVLITDV